MRKRSNLKLENWIRGMLFPCEVISYGTKLSSDTVATTYVSFAGEEFVAESGSLMVIMFSHLRFCQIVRLCR